MLPATVLAYVRMRLLPAVRLPNGNYIFEPGAPQRVREIYRERMARRGGRHERKKAA